MKKYKFGIIRKYRNMEQMRDLQSENASIDSFTPTICMCNKSYYIRTYVKKQKKKKIENTYICLTTCDRLCLFIKR